MSVVQSIRSSLHSKILFAFMAVAIVPYILIILLFSFLARNNMIEQEHQMYTLQAQQAKNLIDSRLNRLDEQVKFLSSLELFDDLISSDIDHRISRALEQKSRGLSSESVTFLALDHSGMIVASSRRDKLQQMVRLDLNGSNSYISKETIFFCQPIYSSFDHRALGYLVAKYPLDNLRHFVPKQSGVSFAILNSTDTVLRSSHFFRSDLQTQVKLKGVLQGHTLVYFISDQHISDFINKVLLYLLALTIIGAVAIVLVSKRLAKHISAPILKLKETAGYISKTHDYTTQVKVNSSDETYHLAEVFNHLVKVTDNTLQKLAQENNIRLQRFVELTELFSQMSALDDKRACIDLSIHKVGHMLAYPLYFAEHKPSSALECRAIEIHDFTQNTTSVYGYLYLKEPLDSQESRFLDSVVKMIVSQMERIELIGKIRLASDAKTSFISNMSHELRTPLNAIIGFSQYLIMYEGLNHEQQDSVAKIESSAMHLLKLINNILDIAKIESGKFEVEISHFDLFDAVDDSLQMLLPLASEKELSAYIEEQDSKIVIQSDKKLLKQIVINLISNAIKFTDSGGVKVEIYVQNNQAIVEVQDSGIGIDPDQLQTIFDEFVQLKSSNNSRHKGTGLGLSLSLQLASAIGATLTLHSRGSGFGSVAILKIPLSA